jgi:hypothetical protein
MINFEIQKKLWYSVYQYFVDMATKKCSRIVHGLSLGIIFVPEVM